MNYLYAATLGVFSVLAFYYASRVFYKANRTKKTYRAFAITAMGSSLWCLGYGAMQIIQDEKIY